MLVVDLSSSMKAQDLSPDRMQATKQALKVFINGLEKDRIGLTVFAGSVSLQSPLTLDYRTAKMMIDIIIFYSEKYGKTNNLPIMITENGTDNDIDRPGFVLDMIEKMGDAMKNGHNVIWLFTLVLNG
jgi:Beta-glucosidase/6-phospho-beta-glucosidase/beta-galactosidase